MMPRKTVGDMMIPVGVVFGVGLCSVFVFALFIGTVDCLYETFIVSIYTKRDLGRFLLGIIVLFPLFILDYMVLSPLVSFLLKKFGFTWEIKRHGEAWPKAE